MMAWGWISDRMGERRWNLFWACMLATVGLVIAGMTMGTWWSLAGMCIATAGFYGTKGPFWSMPSMMLTGIAAAAGDRVDQLDRQCRRRGRAGHGRLDQGLHRQLLGRALWPGGVHRRLGV